MVLLIVRHMVLHRNVHGVSSRLAPITPSTLHGEARATAGNRSRSTGSRPPPFADRIPHAGDAGRVSSRRALLALRR